MIRVGLRPRRSPLVAVVLGAAGVALGGAGAAAELQPQQRVVQPGELPGFTSAQAPRVVFGARAYANLLGDPSLVPLLRRAGFTRGAVVAFQSPRGLLAYSLHYEVGAGRRGQDLVARLYQREKKPKGATATPVAFPGIPGARALRLRFEDGAAQTEVLFARGRHAYLVTVINPKGPAGLPDGALRRAARALYQRIAAAPPEE